MVNLCRAACATMLIFHSVSGWAGQWYWGDDPTAVQNQRFSDAPGAQYGGFTGQSDGIYDRREEQDYRYESPGLSIYSVPSTQGYRFRDMEDPPTRGDDGLPKFRPSTLGGNTTPYTWGAPSGQWPEGYLGPAPVFRPLEPEELERTRVRQRESRPDRGVPRAPVLYETPEYGIGGLEYYPDMGFGYVPEW